MTLINPNFLIGIIESNTTEIPLANHLNPQNYSAGCDAIGMMDLGG